MRFLPPILAALVALSSPAYPEDDLGADARAAKLRWVRLIQEADVAYVQELEQAKEKAIKSANLKRAQGIEAEIEAIRAKFTASDGREILGEFMSLKRLLTTRKWKYRTKTTSSIIEFRADGTYVRDGKPPLKWEIKGDRTLTIHYIRGESCTWEFPKERTEVLEGRFKSDNSVRWLAPL